MGMRIVRRQIIWIIIMSNYMKGKADVQLGELLIAGNKRDDEGFYYVPREFANIYMIYLSNYIAKK